MKRFISAIIAILCLVSFTDVYASAKSIQPQLDNSVIQTDCKYIGDGLYIYTELNEYSLSADIPSTLSLSSTKNATLTSTITDSSGTVLVKYVLSASFSYNGSTALCTSSTYSTNVYASGWSFANTSSAKSGNVAYGSFTAVNKVMLITVQTINRNLSISCDKDGNISKSY